MFLMACSKEEVLDPGNPPTDQEIIDNLLNLDLNDLSNYANQPIPNYITKDNTPAINPVTDVGATLGRVLFYDTQLSFDNSTSCASCHSQTNAFSDLERQSTGANGLTGRHSMRLINTRFARERNFFWDERASSLEEQTTMPIRDHGEMGFSGENGDPSFEDLIDRLQALDYYNVLFNMVYGDDMISETRIQNALAQFVRSIQSFDSKFDEGRALVNNNIQDFPNFTADENAGKRLFIAPPVFDADGSRIGGGVGCQGCHGAPEFDIAPNSGNNGITGVIGAPLNQRDFTITRSPSLRDLFNPEGQVNGPFMHNGISSDILTIINHYNSVVAGPLNNNLDPRLRPNGNLQRLNLPTTLTGETAQLIAFLETLTGSDVYTNEKWSDPFK